MAARPTHPPAERTAQAGRPGAEWQDRPNGAHRCARRVVRHRPSPRTGVLSPAGRPHPPLHPWRASEHHRHPRRPSCALRPNPQWHRPDGGAVVASTSTGAPNGCWQIRESCWAQRARTSPRRSGPAGNGLAKRAPGSSDYSVDEAGATAAFVLSGRVWACDIAAGRAWELATAGAAIDPAASIRPDAGSPMPQGVRCGSPNSTAPATGRWPSRTATPWCGARRSSSQPRRWIGIAGSGGRRTASRSLRSGTTRRRSASGTWPTPRTRSESPPQQRYPAAGARNVAAGLWHLGLDGSRREIDWDTDDFPYLTRVSWTAGGAVFEVMSRDQTRTRVHGFDPEIRCRVTAGRAARRHLARSGGRAPGARP